MIKTCKDCGKQFEISEKEIKFYEAKSLVIPCRCKDCRDKRKNGNGHVGATLESFLDPAIIAELRKIK